MADLTVACVWVKGNVDYGPEYVTKLRSMVERNLSIPHEFVCLTDRPQLLPPAMFKIGITAPEGIPGWWAKVQLFNPKLPLLKRRLYLDLDSLVVGSLDGIVEQPAEFALLPPGGNFQPRTHRTVRLYNSSVMVWDLGARTEIYTHWSHEVAEDLWGDQDWIGELYPHETTMPAEWFPRLSELADASKPPKDARVILCKKPKNHVAAETLPWAREVWR